MNEIKVIGLQANQTYYAVVLNAAGQIANNDAHAWEAVADGNYPAYAVALTEQGTATGIYFGNFPMWVTTAGTYDVVVSQQTGDNPSASDEEVAGGSVVWNGSAESDLGSGFVSPAYVKTVCPFVGSVDDSALQPRIYAASDAIRRYCNREFSPSIYVEYGDAKGSDTLILTQRPVMALTSVSLYPHDDAPEEYAAADVVLDASAALVQFHPNVWRRFPSGFQSVKAVYTAGYVSLPEDLKIACAMLTARLYAVSGRDPTITAEKTANYQVNYSAAASSDNLFTPDIRGILDRYRSLPL